MPSARGASLGPIRVASCGCGYNRIRRAGVCCALPFVVLRAEGGPFIY